jgi:hypothetical protein
MLVFKHEFRETICRLYLEKHSHQSYLKILAKINEQNGNLHLNVSAFSDYLLASISFFDLLSTQEGFLTL